ncbi:hypothetical protein E4U11_001702 [Claviceps purpurea]|nr:hypothetical protein E4U11_001702 [Claviceps purpurea]
MGCFSTSVSYFAFSALHLVCFALALAVCGLYGQDLSSNHHNSKWVYAVVVGSLSAITCVIYFIPALLRHSGIIGAGWNFILFILWIALFGVFGSLFIHENPEGNGGIQRMKNAVWVDLVSVNNGPLNNTTLYDVSIPIQCLPKPDLRTDAGYFLIRKSTIPHPNLRKDAGCLLLRSSTIPHLKEVRVNHPLLRNPRIGESPDNLLRNPRISHTKEVHGNVRNAHTPSRSLTLPPPADPLYSPRDACDAGIMVGKSPGNARIAVALPRIYEARASITGLQTRPLRNKIAAGDLIETTAHPGHYGVMEEKQFR